MGLTDDDGALTGPFNAMLRAPELGFPLQRIGEELRFRSTLDPMVRELATLVTARRWNSDYEWQAHERLARAAGMSTSIIDAVREGEHPPVEGDPVLAATYELTLVVLHERPLTDDRFAHINRILGERR